MPPRVPALTVHIGLEQLEEHVVSGEPVQYAAQKLPAHAVYRARETVTGLRLPRVPLTGGQSGTQQTQSTQTGLRLPRVPLAGGQSGTQQT